MNWKTIFKTGDVVTTSDLAELQKIENSTKQLRELADRINTWPSRNGRLEHVGSVASQLADNPASPELYRQLELAVLIPDEIDRHRDVALREIGGRIEAAMFPQHAIIRRCLQRALDQAESELRKTETKERKLATDEDYDFSPSGRVLALQQRVMQLRNAVAAPIPGEPGCLQSPGGWRERLAEWL